MEMGIDQAGQQGQARSIDTSAFSGMATDAREPAATIVLPRITMAESGTEEPPRPSINVAPTIALTASLAGAAGGLISFNPENVREDAASQPPSKIARQNAANATAAGRAAELERRVAVTFPQ